MGYVTPATSPWSQRFEDTKGNGIGLSVVFDEATRALTGITLYREEGCRFDRILIGTDAAGSPDDTDKVIVVAPGSETMSAQEMNRIRSAGLNTIEDIIGLNITAGLPRKRK